MVDRVYQRNTSDSAPQPPTDPSIGYPTGGNPAEGVPATVPGPYWYHMITESLRRVVVAAGLEPDHLNLDRLKDAVRQAATESLAGLMKVATQTQVDAGEDDATAVTPKKLRWGVSYSIGVNGFIALPSWLGRFIFQWGLSSQTTTSTYVTFNIVLPERVLHLTEHDRDGGSTRTIWQLNEISTTGFRAANIATINGNNLTIGQPTISSCYWLLIGR